MRILNKYLHLEFRDAKLYPLKDGRGRLTKDKIFDINGRRDREYEFVEPITVHQISNMLHVLFGQRPKPTHRETVYQRSEYLFQKAMDSYLKLNTVLDNKGNLIRESTQTKKAVHNAWSTTAFITWSRVKDYAGDYFPQIQAELIRAFGQDILSKPFADLVPMIKTSTDTQLINFFEGLKDIKLTALHTYIFDERGRTHINASSKTRLTVLSGLDSIVKFSGNIIVPVNDDDIEIIRSNKGCATILDGGLVMIKTLTPDYNTTIDGYIKVSDISLEIKQ